LAGLAVELAMTTGALRPAGASSVLHAESIDTSRAAKGAGFITGMEVRMRCPRWRTD
jgi:hypothetical protein